MLPAPVVEAVLSEYFHYSPGVLKVRLLLREEVRAPVAHPIPVVLVLYRDKGANEKPENALFLSFLW